MRSLQSELGVLVEGLVGGAPRRVSPAPAFPSRWTEQHVEIGALPPVARGRPGSLVASARPPWDRCPYCDGVGSQFETDERGYSFARPCRCADLHERAARFNAARIPAQFAQASLDATDWSRAAVRGVRRAVEQFMGRWAPGVRGLLFSGPNGTGKSHVAAAIVRELTLGRGLSAVWAGWSHVLDELRACYADGSPEWAVTDRYQRAGLLVVDDLGDVATRRGEWAAEALERILGWRLEAGATVVVTTNLAPAELDAALGHRVASRLTGATLAVELRGDDSRRRAAT